MTDPAETVRAAEDAERRMRQSARWYPLWVTVFGLFTVVLVALTPVMSSLRGTLFTGVGFVVVIGLWSWRTWQPVRPVSDMRIAIWIGLWLVLFLLVVLLVGPAVAGGSVALWALLGVVQALPAFVEAGVWARRTR